MARDSVCGKELEESKFNEQSEYKGKRYYFCSNDCKIIFDNNPSKYEVKVIIRKKKG